MSVPSALAARRSIASPSFRSRVFPAAIGLLALATTAAGVLSLFVHERGAVSEHVLAPAGIVLLLAAFLQWRTAWRLWCYPVLASRVVALRQWTFWRRLLVGVFLAYAAAAMIGPVPYIEVAFGTAVTLWCAIVLLPLAASPSIVDQWHQWAEAHGLRRIGNVAFAAIVVLTLAEVGLRTHQVARQQGWLGRTEPQPPRSQPLQLALAADEPHAPGAVSHFSPARFRVAVLSDRPLSTSIGRDGFVARVEQALPGVEIVQVGAEQPWSSQPSVGLAAELSAARPDLVLAMFAVCENLARETPDSGWFDWRQTALAQLVTGPTDPVAAVTSLPAPAGDFESFLCGLAPQLAACRTPIDETMHARWQRTYDALDGLVTDCRASRLAVVLVLVPGEFQVNRALRETLVRRAGYTDGQVDVELPQRKLACFAERRQVPLIDLLPSLRMCSQSPYQRNDTAWNEEGHAAAATAIGGWLSSRYGAQLAVAPQFTSAP